MYAQMQGQMEQMDGQIKDQAGTIEPLERQLVQAGIKGKVMQGAIELEKNKQDIRGSRQSALTETKAEQKLLRNLMKNEADMTSERMDMAVKRSGNNVKKD